jgi:hypothetical protein
MGFFDDIGGQPRTWRSWPRPDGQLPVPMATRGQHRAAGDP